MANYSSRLKNEPFPNLVKETVEEEIEKIKSGFGHNKENREE